MSRPSLPAEHASAKDSSMLSRSDPDEISLSERSEGARPTPAPARDEHQADGDPAPEDRDWDLRSDRSSLFLDTEDLGSDPGEDDRPTSPMLSWDMELGRSPDRSNASSSRSLRSESSGGASARSSVSSLPRRTLSHLQASTRSLASVFSLSSPSEAESRRQRQAIMLSREDDDGAADPDVPEAVVDWASHLDAESQPLSHSSMHLADSHVAATEVEDGADTLSVRTARSAALGAADAELGPDAATLMLGASSHSLPIQPLPRWRKLLKHAQRWWAARGSIVLVVLVYFAATFAVVAERFYYYRWGGGKQFFDYLGYGIVASRSAAAALRLNCALIFFPVMRNFITFLRGTFVANFLPLDYAIPFHMWLARAVLFWVGVHWIGHYFNFLNTVRFEGGAPAVQLTGIYRLAFLSLPGATGHVMVLVMVLMFTAAAMRHESYEIFWYTHHLWFVFIGCLIAHGQWNLYEPAQAWMWVVGPVALYLLERALRVLRSKYPVVVVAIVTHPGKVIELCLKLAERRFLYRAGQHVFVCVPSISRLQWHPFSLSSAPDDEFFSVHIRVVGDWTTKLWEKVSALKPGTMGTVWKAREGEADRPPDLRIQIDGPFGTPAQSSANFRALFLAATGIGATPFSGVIRHHHYQWSKGEALDSRIHFVWVSRDVQSMEWFIDQLLFIRFHHPKNFSFDVFITGKGGVRELESRYGDRWALVAAHAHSGRPQWRHAMEALAAANPGNKEVGVFFCGHPLVSKEIFRSCRAVNKFHSLSPAGSARLIYRRELFGW